MKRYAVIFFAAIFVPSLVLGWLALRTAGEQRVVIERQAADLHQAETDAIAATVREAFVEKQRGFAEAVRVLSAAHGAAALAESYGPMLRTVLAEGGVAFAISPAGKLVYPAAGGKQEDKRTREFLSNNATFLSNTAPEEIYQTRQAPQESQLARGKRAEAASSWSDAALSKTQQYTTRNTIPQREAKEAQAAATSRVAPEFSDFQTAVGSAAQGTLARFAQDELQVILWVRPDPRENWLFGLLLGPEDLAKEVKVLLPPQTDGTEIALLDERAKPVARVPAGFSADWRHPFVATEVGEVLPHWEVALYLTNPGALTDSADLVRLTLVLLIALALAAILAGGYIVAADTRRQLALAQKKTDFVSNVSHELKTPLTSIRMFSELLADDRVQDPVKRKNYLRIIAGESERLARLVNNVLDFARLEKHRKTYDMRELDLRPVVERIWEAESLRLGEAGFATAWEDDGSVYPVRGDADAIAQVLINLISNAEKYAGEEKKIGLLTSRCGENVKISVKDRGVGVVAGMEEKIFEAFFRADDSLASGVQGSGLGLTLSRSIARDHEGELICRRREGGGSVFTMTLPVSRE